MKRYTATTLIGASFALILLTALSVVNALRPATYMDPFTDFDALAPGQPVSGLPWESCDTTYYFYGRVEGGIFCYLVLEDGPFESVTVTAENDKIAVLWFKVDELQVGDLVYRWGRPDSVRQSRRSFTTLRWVSGVYATVDSSGWYTLGSPVKYVAIREPVPEADPHL